jgi:hypothetical protein
VRLLFPFSILISFLVVSGSFNRSFAETRLPLNPTVTQGTIEKTICVRGWTKTVRPPVSYTGPLKQRLMVESGVPPEGEDTIKLDHKIPLALGGSPDSIANLILQPDDEAKDKDRVEVCLSRTVCAGRITLGDAQRAIWENWRSAGRLCSGYKVINEE